MILNISYTFKCLLQHSNIEVVWESKEADLITSFAMLHGSGQWLMSFFGANSVSMVTVSFLIGGLFSWIFTENLATKDDFFFCMNLKSHKQISLQSSSWKFYLKQHFYFWNPTDWHISDRLDCLTFFFFFCETLRRASRGALLPMSCEETWNTLQSHLTSGNKWGWNITVKG